jgi:hypothetical protein
MKQVKNGFSHEMNGWLYVSVKGTARERGYAYGQLVASDMKEIFKMLEYTVYEDNGKKWDFFIDLSTKMLKPTIKEHFPEFYEEMEGFAEGCTQGGTPTTLDEIIAWNNSMSLTGYIYPNVPNGESGAKRPGEGGAPDKCSAFIAVGDYTADGKIVAAHNDFANFVDGQYGRVIIDMQPTNGCRFLMQGTIGWIWSGSDFFVTQYGIIGTETTIGGFLPYENNYPISCRMRKAIQYGKNLEDYEKIILEGNSGDYASSWLFGDVNTNEIMRVELGLKYHNTEKTKNGYFIGFNATYDPRIRNLECANSGFDDIRRHQGSRRVRLADLMEEHKGKINIEIAQQIISDHYDVYLNKENPCSRTICAHYDMDAREYMSQSDRPKPYQPRGAINGKVCDSTMAKNMSFYGRYGNSCGIPFNKESFCSQHREWAFLKPYLHDRPQQPWTLCIISGKNQNSNRKTNKQTKKKTTRIIMMNKTKSNKSVTNLNK